MFLIVQTQPEAENALLPDRHCSGLIELKELTFSIPVTVHFSSYIFRISASGKTYIACNIKKNELIIQIACLSFFRKHYCA